MCGRLSSGSLLSRYNEATGSLSLSDPGFALFQPLREWLMSDTTLVTKACLLSSAISDVTMIFLIVSSVAGATFR